MRLPSDLLLELEDMPRELQRALRLVPAGRLGWKPESWGGCPGESFSAIEHVCHLRDIEQDGYHVRIRRMLDESNPWLELRSYDQQHLAGIQWLAGKIASARGELWS